MRGNLLMSAKERERKVVMEDLEKGRMSQKEASGRLGVMEWQLKGGAVIHDNDVVPVSFLTPYHLFLRDLHRLSLIVLYGPQSLLPSRNALPEDRYKRFRTFWETDSGGDSILQHRGLIYLFYEHTILRNP